MKYKPLDEFRRYIAKGYAKSPDGGVVEANRCLKCEDNPRAWGKHSDHRQTAINDQYTNDYQCAFIGNTPYKEICKIFRIRYEETSTNSHS